MTDKTNYIDVKFLYRTQHGHYMAVWMHGYIRELELQMDVLNPGQAWAREENVQRDISMTIIGNTPGLQIDIRQLSAGESHAIEKGHKALEAVFEEAGE